MKASCFVRVDYNTMQKARNHLFQPTIDNERATCQNILNISERSLAMTTLRNANINANASVRTAGASSIIAILTVGVVGVDAHIPF